MEKTSVEIEPNKTINPDGWDKNQNAICEIYSRVGELKPAQADKVASDMLKLVLFEKSRKCNIRKIMCFGSEQAASVLKGNSWLSLAAKEFNIEILVAELTNDQQEMIIRAQNRQRR